VRHSSVSMWVRMVYDVSKSPCWGSGRFVENGADMATHPHHKSTSNDPGNEDKEEVNGRFYRGSVCRGVE
jgi:hypothetical protein